VKAECINMDFRFRMWERKT